MRDEPNATAKRRSSHGRRFRTADAVILLTAVAIGVASSCWVESYSRAIRARIAAASPLDSSRAQVSRGPGSWRDSAEKISSLAKRLVNLSAPVLATLSLALIPIGLLSPRPRWPLRARRPGTAAAIASALAILYVFASFAVKRLAMPPMFPGMFVVAREADVIYALNCLPTLVGLAIVTSWTTFLVGRRWRAEPTWIDRLGRIVAVAWIAAGLFTACHDLLFRFVRFSASMMIWG